MRKGKDLDLYLWIQVRAAQNMWTLRIRIRIPTTAFSIYFRYLLD
jgi:hypothetical protein